MARGGPYIRIEAHCSGCMYLRMGGTRTHCERINEPIEGVMTPPWCPLLPGAVRAAAAAAKVGLEEARKL